MILRVIVALSLLLVVSGCATFHPDGLRTEIEHVSHPLAGYPFWPTNEEDALSQLNALLIWRNGAWYAESGVGYKLEDSGMYGPRLTFTARVGREFSLE